MVFGPTKSLRNVLCLVGISLLCGQVAFGQNDIRQSTSLKFAPSDAGFYLSAIQLRKQVDSFLGSNAFRRIQELPIAQMAFASVREQWEKPKDAQAQTIKLFLEMPENKQLLQMLLDGVSHETFFYGEESAAEFIGLLNQMGSVGRQAQVDAIGTNEAPIETASRQMLQELTKRADRIKIPDLVLGLKLSDSKLATAQIARLESIAGLILGQQKPEWKDRLKRQQLSGSEFLTFQWQGTDLPWDDMRMNVPEDQRADFDKVAASFKKLTLSVAIGLYQDYLVLSVGNDLEHLAKLGQGTLLANRAEMAPLKSLGARDYRFIAFASGSFAQQIAAQRQGKLDDLIGILNLGLSGTPLSQGDRKELVNDALSFRQQLFKYLPELGATSSFVWRSDRGFEGHQYQWSAGKLLQGDRRLSILDHTGGALGFFAIRTKTRPEDYEFATKFLERLIYHSEKIGLPRLQAEDRATYEKVRQELTPLVQRWRATIRDKIIPALADGQSALVLDAQTNSKQWHQLIPASPKPLPMLEIAFVLGVSDPEKLKEGVRESVAIGQEAIGRLHKLFPEKVPDIKIPAAQNREVPGGVVYYFVLPTDMGFDKQIAPNAGLGKEVAVLALLPKQTVRLLNVVTPSFEGPLARSSQPLAAAAYMNVAKAVAAFRPWVEYGVQVAESQKVGEAEVNMAKDPVRVLLDVVACLREFSAVTYTEGSAAVSHFEWHIRDLE